MRYALAILVIVSLSLALGACADMGPNDTEQDETASLGEDLEALEHDLQDLERLEQDFAFDDTQLS